MATVDITGEQFATTIEGNDIVFVDFWAEWCGPCKQFGPTYSAVSEKHSDVLFTKVDTEAEQQLAAEAGITSIPTLMAFREKVLVFSQPGALNGPQLEQVIGAACAAGIAGFIATNTTVARAGLSSPLVGEVGGLSGRPLAERARQTVAGIFGLTAGRLPIIGVGGVASGADAYARIRAGASLVQIYTAMIYHGPSLPSMIARDLARLLRRDGFSSVAQAVGADA